MVAFLQLIVFILLQIILLPVAIIGIVPAVYKEMVVSKRLGVSFTAGQVIQAKWLMHYFGTRKDESCVAFLKHFSITSHVGMMLTMSAGLLANKICGFRLIKKNNCF